MRGFGQVLMAKRFKKYQIDALKLAFDQSEHLTKQMKIDLVRVTGLDMEQVASWFNRKRARKRARKSMEELQRIIAKLEQLLQEHQERETKLQEELQETTMREAGLDDENRRLKHRLTILEGDRQLDSVMKFIRGDIW